MQNAQCVNNGILAGWLSCAHWYRVDIPVSVTCTCTAVVGEKLHQKVLKDELTNDQEVCKDELTHDQEVRQLQLPHGKRYIYACALN